MFKLIFSSFLIFTFIAFNAHASDHNLCEGSPEFDKCINSSAKR